jgi:hypothetical protein
MINQLLYMVEKQPISESPVSFFPIDLDRLKGDLYCHCAIVWSGVLYELPVDRPLKSWYGGTDQVSMPGNPRHGARKSTYSKYLGINIVQGYGKIIANTDSSLPVIARPFPTIKRKLDTGNHKLRSSDTDLTDPCIPTTL